MSATIHSSQNSLQTKALEMKLGQKKAEFQRLKGDSSIDMSEKKKKAGEYLREIRQLENQQGQVKTTSPKVVNENETIESGFMSQAIQKAEMKLHELTRFEGRA